MLHIAVVNTALPISYGQSSMLFRKFLLPSWESAGPWHLNGGQIKKLCTIRLASGYESDFRQFTHVCHIIKYINYNNNIIYTYNNKIYHNNYLTRELALDFLLSSFCLRIVFNFETSMLFKSQFHKVSCSMCVLFGWKHWLISISIHPNIQSTVIITSIFKYVTFMIYIMLSLGCGLNFFRHKITTSFYMNKYMHLNQNNEKKHFVIT